MSKKEAVSKGRQCDEHRNKKINDNLENPKFRDQEECSCVIVIINKFHS